MKLAPGQAPLYEVKANLFKALAHPARIRALELLSADPAGTLTVSELLERIEIEPSHLSQHLRVLRRHRVVVSERRGSHVHYALAHPGVAELLAIARRFLLDSLEAEEAERAAALLGAPELPGGHDAGAPAPGAGAARRTGAAETGRAWPADAAGPRPAGSAR
ncbi:metalloregulator ArsR/SmtB family transcription factor [Zafaria sp. J156]|uniref:metalloregulator ArsR/SmtB family transcription factor n=1 Tax=Zafaria sp. J156 TaxID=3116490 RepID=UPI002E79D52F|nr:metalloregulator ArsR/SmtB family transcription factor [Zafaria sp. J156]MEE1620615.1 metalloregulator ArsR/SmtB family transcription factor [Zafaria sp. J156]